MLEAIRSAAFSGVTEPEATALRRESSAAAAMNEIYSEFEGAGTKAKPAAAELSIVYISIYTERPITDAAFASSSSHGISEEKSTQRFSGSNVLPKED